MKKIVYGLLATAAGLVALFSYHTSLDSSIPVATTAPANPIDNRGAPAADGRNGDAKSSLHDGTYTGESASTPYGQVQVQLTVGGGKITRVDVPRYPDTNRRDLAINQRAIPQLVSETMTTQSAEIDMVSGATYTSDGYTRSLQSAIDQALQ